MKNAVNITISNKNILFTFIHSWDLELSRFCWETFLGEITEIRHGSLGSQSVSWIIGEELLEQTEDSLVTRPLHGQRVLTVLRPVRKARLEIPRES